MRNENRVLKKYHPALCDLFRLYRIFGLIHFDNYGRMDKRLRLYSIINFVVQTALLYAGFYLHFKYNFSEMDTVSRIPFFLQSASLSSSFTVSAILYLRKNEVLVKMFANMERIGSTIITDERQLLKTVNRNRIMTFLVLVLLTAASVPLMETVTATWDLRLTLLMSYMLSFVAYLRELLLIVFMTSAMVVLQDINQKLRNDKPAVGLIKQLRLVLQEFTSKSPHFFLGH